MVTWKHVALAVVIAPIALIGYVRLSKEMRYPHVDPAPFIPGGLRAIMMGMGEPLEIHGYNSAAVRSARFDGNLPTILRELGLEYLNDLHRLKGRGDGYGEWQETPIDVERLTREAPEDAEVLAAMKTACSLHRDKSRASKEYNYSHEHCYDLAEAEQGGGMFYAHGERKFLLLNPKRASMHMAFAGPYTGRE